MVMIGDENDDYFVSLRALFQKANANQIKTKSTARLLLRTVHEESKAQNRCS